MLSAIALGPNRSLVNYIREMAAELGDLCVYKTLYSYPSAHELLQLLNVFTPEVVFLDVGSSSAALDLAKEIRASQSKTATIGILQDGDEEKLKEAPRENLTAVLVMPCGSEELRRTIGQAIQAQVSGFRDNIIAILPSKGGSGATTTALHLASALVQEAGKSVIFLETDLNSGPVAALLDLDPPNTMLDALENSQWLSDSMWGRFVTKTLGIDLLPMPGFKATAALSRWEYQRLLTFVRCRYDMVVADLPELLENPTEAVVTEAKVVYVICTPEKGSLFLARRRIDELKSRNTREDRIRIALNRCSPGDPRLGDIEKILQRRVSVLLPNDDSLLRRAVSDGQLASRESELGKAFAGWARELAGLEPLAPPRPPSEPKAGLLARIRSRAFSPQA